MNDPKFVEKVAEEMWDAGQISSIAEGITYVNFPWSTVTGKIRELYLAMASRAIDVVNQEINASLPVRVDEQSGANTPLHHVLALYGIFPNDEPKSRTIIPADLFNEELD